MPAATPRCQMPGLAQVVTAGQLGTDQEVSKLKNKCLSKAI